MSQIREIKDRMNGIQSTMKITKAMYMISSTKMNTANKKPQIPILIFTHYENRF